MNSHEDTCKPSMDNKSNIDIEQLRRILGSCSINFLFGAGVNGSSFPQFSGFVETKKALIKHGQPGDNIEQELRKLNDVQRNNVTDVFCREFETFVREIDWGSGSIENIKDLLLWASSIVSKTENRHPESKRINIFTLNYDHIVETQLNALGQFSYTLTAKKPNAFLPFEIVGYNTNRREYIPTFAVYKLHGTMNAFEQLVADEIMLPGADKLGNVISSFYETIFAMKGELLRSNSVLFVIGYSWNDEHINGVISDAIDNGLVVYHLQYGNDNPVPNNVQGKMYIIEPPNDSPKQDTTLTLAGLFKEVLSR